MGNFQMPLLILLIKSNLFALVWKTKHNKNKQLKIQGIIDSDICNCQSDQYPLWFHTSFCQYFINNCNLNHLSPVKRICVFEHSVTNFTAHAQPFRGARDLAFCLKVPLDSLLVWASSEGSSETVRMRRLAWTFAARICDKYQIRLTRSICEGKIRSRDDLWFLLDKAVWEIS